MARNTTLVVEAKHARRRAFREMRHQVRSHRLMCAEYMLRETARIHQAGRKRCGLRRRRAQRQVKARVAPAPLLLENSGAPPKAPQIWPSCA